MRDKRDFRIAEKRDFRKPPVNEILRPRQKPIESDSEESDSNDVVGMKSFLIIVFSVLIICGFLGIINAKLIMESHNEVIDRAEEIDIILARKIDLVDVFLSLTPRPTDKECRIYQEKLASLNSKIQRDGISLSRSLVSTNYDLDSDEGSELDSFLQTQADFGKALINFMTFEEIMYSQNSHIRHTIDALDASMDILRIRVLGYNQEAKKFNSHIDGWYGGCLARLLRIKEKPVLLRSSF